MERAIELEPEDPIVNDHPDDGHGKLVEKGKHIISKKTLLFNPTPELKLEIEKKLDTGLP